MDWREMEYANWFLIKKGKQLSSMDLLFDMISIQTEIPIGKWGMCRHIQEGLLNEVGVISFIHILDCGWQYPCSL